AVTPQLAEAEPERARLRCPHRAIGIEGDRAGAADIGDRAAGAGSVVEAGDHACRGDEPATIIIAAIVLWQPVAHPCRRVEAGVADDRAGFAPVAREATAHPLLVAVFAADHEMAGPICE